MQTQIADTRLLEPPIKGKRCFEIQGTFVTVDERYTVQNMIGCGAYGVVYSAFDSVTNSDVAIKKIQTAFSDVIDAKRILREIKILSK
jgi:mitogen-activated protein kinase 1/3